MVPDFRALLQQCQWALHQALQMGHKPVTYVMNETTRKVLGDGIRAANETAPSRLQEFKRKLLHKPTPKLDKIFGIPILINDHYGDFIISLNWHPAMDLQHGTPVMSQQTQVTQGTPGAAAPAPENNPFVKTEVVDQAQAPAPEEDKPVSLEDIAQHNGKSLPTVTDVLIRGVEQAESLAHVIVIRKFHNGDIDMSMSCNPDEAVGIVQKAQIWLAHGRG